MNDEIEQLKHHPSLLRVYGSYVKLRKENDKWVGICPLHSEKSGSFVVYAKDMLYHCFGCNASGNCIQLVQKMDNISFKDAVEKVKEAVGGKWESQRVAVEQTFRPVVETEKKHITLSLDQYKKYEENLKTSKPAQEWLKSRGIEMETALRLHTGFVQNLGMRAGQSNQDIAAGGWIAFPCVAGDKVTSVKYRSIVRKAFTKQSGMATALYNTDAIDVFEDVYLAEGEVDSITLEQAGFRSVSLASASSHPTAEQKDLLKRASRIILAGDCDGAVGDEIMLKLWNELGDRTYRLKWPAELKDANQVFLEKCKGDLREFQTLVQELTHEAIKQPLPDVYSLAEVMRSSGDFSLQDNPSRLRFPWPAVDKMTVLLPGSVLAVYATSTGMGKTTWTHQVGLHNALKHSRKIISYQCEMQPEEIGIMTAAQLLRKNRNFITKEDQIEAARILDGVDFYIGSNPHLNSAEEVLDLLEAAICRLGCDVLIIDHFHHICADLNNENAIQSMAAQRIKQMAEKYKCIVLNVGQPRKSTTQNKGKIPHISDAKGSEAYTSKANAVFALHRALNKNGDDTPQNDMYESKLLVQAQKTRSKGTGAAEAYLTGFLEFACFEEVDYTHEYSA